MAGLRPCHPRLSCLNVVKTWMPGTRLRRGFDGLFRCEAAVALAKAARPGMTSFASHFCKLPTKMNSGARWAPEFYPRKISLVSTPILELPGFELPWRQGLYPPLHPPIRRPVTEARSFLDLRLDRVPDHPPPDLAGRLADHIDEFRLIRHGSLLAKCLAHVDPMCSQDLNDFLRDCLEVEARMRE